MNLKNKIIKNNILNLKKIHYSQWNNNIFKYLLFLLSNNQYKKYKDILLLIFDEFIFFNEYGCGSSNFNLNNIKEIRNIINQKNIDFIQHYNKLEKISKDIEVKEQIELEKKINNDLKCSEHKLDYIDFDSIMLDIFDTKFISFGFAFSLIFFICVIRNIFSLNKNLEKKNVFHFKIPLDDNIFTNTILKYFLGNNLEEYFGKNFNC